MPISRWASTKCSSQDILALCNLFNITIFVFTFGANQEGTWSEIHPDPDLVSDLEFKFGKPVPDMYLYNYDDSYYDLLVKDDSRIALLGLVAGSFPEKVIPQAKDEAK